MARRTFGGTAADFLTDSRGNVESGGVGTVWTARTGGTQITDLLDANGAPVTTVSALASPEGMVLFSGPDDGTRVVWVDFGGGRVKMVAEDGYAPLDSAAPVFAVDAATGMAATDRAAIQAQITAATAAGGGIVQLRRGAYVIADAILMDNNVWLRGAGPATSITSTALTNGGSGIGQRQIDATGKTGWRVSDLTLDCSGITSFLSGVRCIHASGSSKYHVERVTFVTPGAAVASIGCFEYWVVDNHVSVASTDAAAHHDGIIDQWAGSHHFNIRGNTIAGNSIGSYGILVTGEDTAGVAAACYEFTITENHLRELTQVGVWVNGRDGINSDFQVANNVIKTVTGFFGIGVADSKQFTITGNVTDTTAGNGIRVYSEGLGGGTTGAQGGIVAGNVVVSANTAANAGGADGSAITVNDNSADCTVSGNRVKGTAHVYAVYLGASTARCEVIGDNYDAGWAGTIDNSAASNRVASGSYTPTLTSVANVASSAANVCKWTRRGNEITVTGRVTVTPTAAASTATQLGISLPLASALSDATKDVAGNGASQFGLTAAISADVTNGRAQLQFPASNTLANVIYFQFRYTVV